MKSGATRNQSLPLLMSLMLSARSWPRHAISSSATQTEHIACTHLKQNRYNYACLTVSQHGSPCPVMVLQWQSATYFA